jgi:hypothetical protein
MTIFQPMLRVIASILLACAITPPVFGQDTAPNPPKSPHSLRLLCVDAVPAASRLVVMEKTDQGWAARWRLTVSAVFLTDVMGFSSRSLALAVDPAPPPADGAFNGPAVRVTSPLKVTPFAEFELPASDTATAVLVPAPSGKEGAPPYRVIPFDTHAAGFAAGRMLVQNFTTQVVAGVFGGKPAKIQPGKSVIIEPGSDQPGEMAQITLATQSGDTWTPFCDTRWPAKTDYRRYLLLIPRADGTVNPFVMPEYPPFR